MVNTMPIFFFDIFVALFLDGRTMVLIAIVPCRCLYLFIILCSSFFYFGQLKLLADLRRNVVLREYTVVLYI